MKSKSSRLGGIVRALFIELLAISAILFAFFYFQSGSPSPTDSNLPADRGIGAWFSDWMSAPEEKSSIPGWHDEDRSRFVESRLDRAAKKVRSFVESGFRATLDNLTAPADGDGASDS